MENRYEVGKTYDDIEIIGIGHGHRYKTYLCRCLKCGYEFEAAPGIITEKRRTGCTNCVTLMREQKKIEEIKSHIGETFGELTITGFAGFMDKPRSPLMNCHCGRCGGDSVIPLTRLLNTGIKMCADCNKKNLEAGRKKNLEYNVEGTKISSINGKRRMNRNNATGHTGICIDRRAGKYRAYIYFRRKQYHLGFYDNLEDAVMARENERNLRKFSGLVRGHLSRAVEKTEPERR